MNLFIINDFYKIYKETGQLNEAGYPTESSVLDYKRYYLQIIGNETDNNIIIIHIITLIIILLE